MTSAELSLWGVPAHPSHDAHRPLPGECAGVTTAKCTTPPRPPGSQELPFLTNPTRCGVPLEVMLALTTYEQPDVIVTSAESMATITGCNKLPFGPELQVALTSAETSSASGINLGLSLAGAAGVKVLEPAAVRWLGVALSRGFSIDPAAAAALGVCTDAEFGLGTDEPAACPGASRVGTISLEVAGFDAPLEGEAFFGAAYRILLDVSGSGMRVKLEVLLKPEFKDLPPFLEFSELPQIPIRDLELSVEESAGLLVTPATCKTYLAASGIESWGSNLLSSRVTRSRSAPRPRRKLVLQPGACSLTRSRRTAGREDHDRPAGENRKTEDEAQIHLRPVRVDLRVQARQGPMATLRFAKDRERPCSRQARIQGSRHGHRGQSRPCRPGELASGRQEVNGADLGPKVVLSPLRSSILFG